MKHFMLAIMMVPMFSLAAAPPLPPQETGIVTPDIAIAVRQFPGYAWNYDTNGDLVVCLPENRERTTDCRLWTLARHSVAPGRTYVGFKVSNGALQIYWK